MVPIAYLLLGELVNFEAKEEMHTIESIKSLWLIAWSIADILCQRVF